MVMKEKILIVDDEREIADLVELYLQNEGYEICKFYNGREALACAKREEMDLAILDVMLPEEDGISILKKLRVRPDTRKLPIIMLTARGQEQDELLGFELGVDEYISKPFSPKILVARVEAILRRSNQLNEDVIEAGGITLDITAHKVLIEETEIELSYKEFELLTYFMKNQNVALSREKILNHVWNYDYFGDARTIDTHVKKLRSKLGDKGEYIRTVWGMGYKFEVNQ